MIGGDGERTTNAEFIVVGYAARCVTANCNLCHLKLWLLIWMGCQSSADDVSLGEQFGSPY